jgi:uncharacterized protein YndB with AHSA1/START domain
MTNHPSELAPTVRIERHLAAPPSSVYAAWTDGSLMSGWMSPFGSATATADPRVGGRLSVVMVDAGVRLEHHGEYLQLDPPRRIQFTWRSPYTNGPSLVTVVLRPDGDGTWLILTHERLPADVVAAHADGWGLMLDRLDGSRIPETAAGEGP